MKQGGTFAFQVPHNMDAPSHALMRQTAANGPWSTKLKNVREISVLAPADYYAILESHASSLDIWETEYLHVLRGRRLADIPPQRSSPAPAIRDAGQ